MDTKVIYDMVIDELDNDILYDMIKHVYLDDLFHLNNGNMSLQFMINDPIFIKNKKDFIHRYLNNVKKTYEHDSSIISAIRNGHLEICKYLVYCGYIGYNPNKKKSGGFFKSTRIRKNICDYLFYAAGSGNLELCKYFVSLGYTDGIGTAFSWALDNGHFNVCTYLISLGITNFDDIIYFSLYQAIRNNRLESCKYLISISNFTNFNWALKRAANFRNLELCKYFVSLGATYVDVAHKYEQAHIIAALKYVHG